MLCHTRASVDRRWFPQGFSSFLRGCPEGNIERETLRDAATYMRVYYGEPFGERQTEFVVRSLRKDSPDKPIAGTVREMLWMWLLCEYTDQIDILELPHGLCELKVGSTSTSSRSDKRHLIRQWDVEDVERWLLDEMAVTAELASAAVKERIDGSVLLELDRSAWVELGSTSLTACKLVAAVKEKTSQ
jgi:hypothetical protein